MDSTFMDVHVHGFYFQLLGGGNFHAPLILLPPSFSYKGLALQNLRSLTCTDNAVGCQLLSQRWQIGIFVLIHLPARYTKVKPEPRRMCLRTGVPEDRIIAVLFSTDPTDGNQLGGFDCTVGAPSNYVCFDGWYGRSLELYTDI